MPNPYIYSPEGPTKKARQAISDGMNSYFATRTEEEEEAHRERASFNMRIRWALFKLGVGDPPTRRRTGGGGYTAPNQAELIAQGRLVAMTIRNLAKRVRSEHPDLIYQSILEGVCAEPPKSLPYLVLIMKAEDDLLAANPTWLSTAGWSEHLTSEELAELRQILSTGPLRRIIDVAKERMRAVEQQQGVIDVAPSTTAMAPTGER